MTPAEIRKRFSDMAGEANTLTIPYLQVEVLVELTAQIAEFNEQIRINGMDVNVINSDSRSTG